MSLAIRLGLVALIIASITVGSRSTVSIPHELLPLPVAPTGPVEARLAQALHGGVQPPDITANFPTTARAAGRRAWLFLWVLAVSSCAAAPREDQGSQAETSPRRPSSQWLCDAPRSCRARSRVPRYRGRAHWNAEAPNSIGSLRGRTSSCPRCLTLIVHAGGRAGQRRAVGRAGPPRHCIAEAAPMSAVRLAVHDLFGATQTIFARAGGRAGGRRAEDRAGSRRHCFAEAAPENPMQIPSRTSSAPVRRSLSTPEAALEGAV